MATTDRVIKPVIAEDGSVHYSSVMSHKSDTSPAVCYKVPFKIIPVVFVPGIMGSNLMSTRTKSEPVWLVDSQASMASWIVKGASKRKMILDPQKTTVYDCGIIPQGTDQKDHELKRRGWGEVSNMSYGAFLVWLENTLDDVYRDTDYGREGLRAQLMKQVVAKAPGVTALSHDEVALSYRYQFPVHAVGYNWLQDNADSAQRLHERIEYFMNYYPNRFNYECKQVILLTHSMGGLVARHYSEVLNQRDKVLGIVHGVMPATGAATAYKRVKAGTEGDIGTSHVLGVDAAEVTAVFAQSPGALQLLPSTEYGKGWLKIRDDQFIGLPVKEPYSEIYTQRHKWWGLVNDQLLNPLDPKKLALDQDWDAFAKLIQKRVQSFHTGISGKYHANTYAFYGDDVQHKTWGDVIWKGSAQSHPGFWRVPPIPIQDELKQNAANDTGTGSQTVVVPQNGWPTRQNFVLQEAGENGDGTVPRRSGMAPTGRSGVQVCVPYC